MRQEGNDLSGGHDPQERRKGEPPLGRGQEVTSERTCQRMKSERKAKEGNWRKG